MDNVVIKSKTKTDLVADLQEMFNNLQKYRMKLNPEKCKFGVPSGKFLGFLVFILRLGEKGLPLFKLLKKNDHFQWTTKAEAAFQELKSTTVSGSGVTADSTPIELSKVIDLSGDEGGKYAMASGSADTTGQNA
ncbi:uncharacterized protein LOC133928086 [Phragmites australis]|uniref:uncharacterized protein LOC133928086 n=1 Tax=Phragmites australis TaxID=29695 RepID=UPI002D79AE80|nr:uncharacterized protein LOC133928086 [Phragmites australis]